MSETTGIATGLVRRYERRTDEPDEYTYDILYVDRLTGKVVMRYDGADPANTSAAYGASSDEDCFKAKGLDFHEEVEVGRCVVPVPPGEVERHQRAKAAREQREREEEEAQDLLSFLGDAASKFSFERWSEGEHDILSPALEARGYTQVRFYMLEEDSFGPLMRGCVALDPSGKRVRFYYG